MRLSILPLLLVASFLPAQTPAKPAPKTKAAPKAAAKTAAKASPEAEAALLVLMEPLEHLAAAHARAADN